MRSAAVDAGPGCGSGGGGAPARLQARIQIAEITRIERHGEPLLGIAEHPAGGSFGIEEKQAQAGGLLVPAGDEERQPLDGDALFPAAQIVEPDQAEAQHARGAGGIGCGGDGGPARLAMLEKSARVGGGKRVCEVGLHAEFLDFPAGELAAEHFAEALAKDTAGAAPPQIGAGRTAPDR